MAEKEDVLLTSISEKSLDVNLLLRALDASISGIIITDNQQPDQPIIYCNKAFEEMTGFSRSEIIGRNCRFLQGDDRNQPERFAIKDAVKSGKPLTIEIKNYRKDGSLFWNELYMSPVVDKEKVTFFIGVQNDVSRRKNAELELRYQKEEMERKVLERTKSLQENEEYLSSIIETVRESLLVLSTDITILSVNEHFFRTFKVTRDETIGKKLYDLGNGQWNIPELKELLEQILPTNNPVLDFEVQYTFPHIGLKTMLLNAFRIEHDGKYKDRILLAIEDVTEKAEIEKRKDDFLSIASHELKTPLTTIKGHVQLLDYFLKNNQYERIEASIDKANKSVQRLDYLIKELLDVSKIKSGNFDLHQDLINFDEMILENVDIFQRAFASHQLVLSGRTNAKVIGDETYLVQVFNNLLSNAIKYSPDAEQVFIHLGRVGDFVKVSIEDKGIGISHGERKKIFERFYRSAEHQFKFSGMGIGLYISQEIIKKHNGSIWVEANQHGGSTFSFTLPAYER